MLKFYKKVDPPTPDMVLYLSGGTRYPMTYFSDHANWLSLAPIETLEMDLPDPTSIGDSKNFFPKKHKLSSEERSHKTASDLVKQGEELLVKGQRTEGLDALRRARTIRHKLVFTKNQWQFAPSLLRDCIRLARMQNSPVRALKYYCLGRHIAHNLVFDKKQNEHLVPLLELDACIAEIHKLLGNYESCVMHAREGLQNLKKAHFPSELDLKITRMTMKFFQLLDR